MAQRQTWETYAKAWKTGDPEERSQLLAAAVHPDCVYSDPTTQARGWAELTAYMEGFQAQMPGGGFETDAFMHHHDRSMATWKMVAGDGAVAGVGTSFGTFADDGRLLTMTGFFDPNG